MVISVLFGYFGSLWLFRFFVVISVLFGYFGSLWLFWFFVVISILCGYFGSMWLFWFATCCTFKSIINLFEKNYFISIILKIND